MANYEKLAYAELQNLAEGRPAKSVGGPGQRGTPNHKLMHAALEYGLNERLGKHDDERLRVLAIGRSQYDPKPGRREGIGLVEGGSFEQGAPAPHDAYHILPTAVIALQAHRRGDEEVCDLWLGVLGRHYAEWKIGASADGQVTRPGARFVGFKKAKPPLEADGFVHRNPGDSLNPVTDACYRLIAGAPQIDNRRRRQKPSWVLKRDTAGWAAAHALFRLLEAGLSVPPHLESKLYAPILVADAPDGERRLYLSKTAEEIGGFIQGFCPATKLITRPGELPIVAWAPNTIPEGFIAGKAIPA